MKRGRTQHADAADEAARIALELRAAELARMIKEAVPGTGFCLVLFDLGEGGNMAYMANGQRAHVVAMLRELCAHLDVR